MFLYFLCYYQLISVHKFERSEYIYNNVLNFDLCFVMYVVCHGCLRPYLFILCLIFVISAVMCMANIQLHCSPQECTSFRIMLQSKISTAY